MQEPRGRIKFQVETKRILEILSREIYDSPYALLRENIQNAYDAILMRHTYEEGNWELSEAHIEVVMNNNELVIIDNGIGMTEEVLRNNYWKAGSTGKKNDLALKAGVIGTFGIGAMANFGVSTRLEVRTKFVESLDTLISSVEREKVSLSEECIDFLVIQDGKSVGTMIRATLDQGQALDVSQAIHYLTPYIQYIPVKLTINGEVISGNDYRKNYLVDGKISLEQSVEVTNGVYSANVKVFINHAGQVAVQTSDIHIQGQAVVGDIVLQQGAGQIMGLRSFFGLAAIPVGNHYGLGGVANLSVLFPTAGREALSRESINIVQQLVSLIEKAITEVLSQSELSDSNSYFLHYIQANNRYDLAANVKIQVQPNSAMIAMGKLTETFSDKNIFYFTGTDQRIIDSFAAGDSVLCHVSQSNPRKQVQIGFIQQLDIPAVPDKVQVLKTYRASDLEYEEVAITLRIMSVLQDDYLIMQAEVIFADLSHNIPIHVEAKKDSVLIYLSRRSSVVIPLLECYKTAYSVFGGFVKDFVRVHLYHRIQNFVPSSTREGADAFHKLLQQRRELYKLETEEIGSIESILADLMRGERSFNEALWESKIIYQSQSDSINRGQVGTVEDVFSDIINSPVLPEKNIATEHGQQGGHIYEASPPIMRLDNETTMKLLTVDQSYAQLNKFNKFLALSDRIFRVQQEFFMSPHSTRVIWGSHRVVYIFAHANSNMTLYYDIELKEPLEGTQAGGDSYPTTTIITQNRIFVPIPDILTGSFQLREGSKEFFVRYDLI